MDQTFHIESHCKFDFIAFSEELFLSPFLETNGKTSKQTRNEIIVSCLLTNDQTNSMNRSEYLKSFISLWPPSASITRIKVYFILKIVFNLHASLRLLCVYISNIYDHVNV